MLKRAAGVLANISSLPSEFGIGCFSKDATDFVSFISTMNFHWWQTLPITTIGDDFSPFNGVSFYAGNSLYINPYDLLSSGLISDEDLQAAKFYGSEYTVDYGFARYNVKTLLEKAILRVDERLTAEVFDFYNQNKAWLADYARYMVLSEQYGPSWREWPEDYRRRKPKALSDLDRDKTDRLKYFWFEQYIFFKQWKQVKDYANGIGVGIIGELPFFTPIDNVEVWLRPEEYLLDEHFGVLRQGAFAPNVAIADGILTGKPAYDFKNVAKNGYNTFLNRFKHCFTLYDALIAEHAEGYAGFWAADAESENAVNGEWLSPIDKTFAKKLKEIVGERTIISGDIVVNTQKHRDFLSECGFLDTKMFQFVKHPEGEGHYPHCYNQNTVAYTSSRSSQTALGWLYGLDDAKRNEILQYIGYNDFGWGAGGEECTSVSAIAKNLLASSAALVIAPIQDLCGFGDNTRLEALDFKSDGNWLFRVYYAALNNINRVNFATINDIYFRNNTFRG